MGFWSQLTGASSAINTFLGVGAGSRITTGTGNVAIGLAAGPTTGTNSVAIGQNALANATSTSGSVCIGNNAGTNISTGSAIVAIGSGAGQGQTTGNYAVLVGVNAGLSGNGAGVVGIGQGALQNASAADTVAIGRIAGNSLTTGTDNIAIGAEALQTTTNGQQNIAIGKGALKLLQTRPNPSDGADLRCMFNIAVGAYVLGNLTTGWENMGLGNNVMPNATTAAVNTAIGSEAMRDCTTGSANTAYGVSALQAVTTGSNNTGVGNAAGGYLVGGNYINTGSYNSFFGANTAPIGTTQTSYMTLIGAGATGSRSNAIFLGRADGSDTTVVQGPLELRSYTVAGLPAAGVGKTAYASNGRRAGEGSGAGTGIPVWSDATTWRTYYDCAAVAA
jgi:trimeric autotransporter adhesin